MRDVIYIEIANDIKKDIEHNYKPGEKLESESMYVKKYGVSRVTIKRALAYLENHKLLYYIKNKGYYVLNPAINRGSKIMSFTHYMAMNNMKVTNKLLKIKLQKPDNDVKDILQLDDNDMVYRINRIRYGDNVPQVIEYCNVSAKLCPGLEKFNLKEYSLYDILKEYYNIKIDRQIYSFNAKTIKGFEAKHLINETSGPALIITTTGYTNMGITPVEYTVEVNNYKTFNYVITLTDYS